MATFDDLVTRTAGRLTGAVGKGRYNVLATTVNASIASVVLTYDPDAMVAPGTIVQINYEQMLIVAVDEDTKTLTVIRGANGTTAAAHSAGTIIELDPRFPRQSVFEALVDEVTGLPLDIYSTEAITVSFPANTNAVELVTVNTPLRVLDAWRLDGQSSVARRPSLSVVQDTLHGQWTSGYGLTIDNGAVYAEPRTVSILVAVELDVADLTVDTNLGDQIGLAPNIESALVYLAGATLLLDKEALRYDTTRQGQSRDAAEVPPDALGTLAKRWREEGMRRVSAERMRLVGRHGWKM